MLSKIEVAETFLREKIMIPRSSSRGIILKTMAVTLHTYLYIVEILPITPNVYCMVAYRNISRSKAGTSRSMNRSVGWLFSHHTKSLRYCYYLERAYVIIFRCLDLP